MEIWSNIYRHSQIYWPNWIFKTVFILSSKVTKFMLSTYKVLPMHTSVIDGIPIPIVVSVSPLDASATVFPYGKCKIPRCSRCRSYLSSVCACSPEAWCCSVCSQIMKLTEPVPQEQLQNNVIEVVQSAEAQPLHHALFVFSSYKEAIRDYLKLLPPMAPLTIATYTDSLNLIPTGCVSQILSEFDSIPFPTASIPFETAVNSIMELLPTLMAPCWVRIFMETPNSEVTKTPLIDAFKKQYTREIRIDLYLIGTSFSPVLADVIQACPGLSKVFNPHINIGELPSFLKDDIDREFAFQLLAVFRSGVAYTTNYISSPFLASEVCDGYVRIPVLPSHTASLSFEVLPPETDDRLRFQAMQCVVKFTRWNPKTNRLSQLFRIISHEFKISNNLMTVLSSTSPSMLFYAWVKEAQRMPPAQMATHVEDRLRSLAPVLVANKHLRPVIKMTFLVKSHPALSAMFWDRLTMGSLLSLSSPSAVDAQFSYSVEIWKDVNTHLETVFSVEEKKRKGDFIFLVKSFPSLFVLTNEGNIDIPENSKMNESIQAFTNLCKPLTVRVVQTELSRVRELLSVDEEDDLPKFLSEVGLESMYEDIV
ncbi:hypothetical protein TRFO_15535 [Tritrichomonas foetus]|uniref:Protein transport protein SEC23 n=1 Tax=Tritrichomonas foetus TaxID=1144522 RepID=A0A1J4KXE7_9EUKA|nr:hypothetical protein TRFO_15535 [Tritrichomonas foetus]|eukprot:OHT14229.1 hypothetical protein TRFO_15535 [Tritrichomonas foetus]